MKLRTILLLILLGVVIYLSSPFLQRLYLSGIFKPLPPSHLSSELPARFMEQAVQASSIVIRHVNVIPMNKDTVLYDRDVRIQHGWIAAVSPASTTDSAYSGSHLIDGYGKYLIPGLTDMHTHINDDNNLLLFLANGITLVRNMSGQPFHLDLKEKIESKDILGPELLTTTPILEGPSAVWKEAPGSIRIREQSRIKSIMDSLINAGYDEIKVYHTLSKSFWQEIADIGKENNIPLAGHIPVELTIDEFLTSYQASFEHLDIYQMNQISPELDLNSKFEMLADNDKWICPTLIVNKYMYEDGIESFNPNTAAYVDTKTRSFWKSRIKDAATDYPEKVDLLRTFNSRSDRILSGTDCINAYVVPGFSLHEELQELVNAGLSNYEALRTSTANPAEYLGRSTELGTVEPGKRARLIMLDANPLENIGNTRKITAIVKDQTLIDSRLTEEMLTEIAKSN